MNNSVSIAVTGSGGSGAVTTGLILLQAMAKAGYYGYMSRTAGPQIRGGESAVMMRFSNRPVHCGDDRFDVLLAMDWHKLERFADEIPLDGNSLIFGDSAAGDIPEILTASGAAFTALDLQQTARSIEGGRANMLGLGSLARLLGLSGDTMRQALQATLGKKGEHIIAASMACIEQGMGFDIGDHGQLQLPSSAAQDSHWNISGNEACGLGALRGGVRFVAAYPITPASDILEWLAPRLEKLGGVLLQAEDELASVNMITGASFGGVPSLTATSGPGLSLMMEGLGLAVASETPIVAIDVMRGGPSTGIPTKSEQSDLNLALYGFHGDAPHLVVAPLDISDCVFATHWAVCLAEQLQTVALVLSDQSLGQTRAVMDKPPHAELPCQRRIAHVQDIDVSQAFQRYQLTGDGVSPMSIPGTPAGMYTADGLEHTERGTPSSMASDHDAQMRKRRDNLTAYNYGSTWARIDGNGPVAIISWGSTSAVCREAAERLASMGIPARVISLRLLLPLNHRGINEVLQGCSSVVVIEQNQAGQLYHYLHAEQVLPPHARSYAKPGPLTIRPGEVVTLISGVINDE